MATRLEEMTDFFPPLFRFYNLFLKFQLVPFLPQTNSPATMETGDCTGRPDVETCHTPCPDICPVSPDLPFRPTISSLLAESPKRFDPGATEGQESVTLVAVNYEASAARCPQRGSGRSPPPPPSPPPPLVSAPNEKSTPCPGGWSRGWRHGNGPWPIKRARSIFRGQVTQGWGKEWRGIGGQWSVKVVVVTTDPNNGSVLLGQCGTAWWEYVPDTPTRQRRAGRELRTGTGWWGGEHAQHTWQYVVGYQRHSPTKCRCNSLYVGH